MAIRTAQSVLDQYYEIRDNLLSNPVKSYTMGDRTFSLHDLPEIERIIRTYEAVVVATQTGPIVADLTR